MLTVKQQMRSSMQGLPYFVRPALKKAGECANPLRRRNPDKDFFEKRCRTIFRSIARSESRVGSNFGLETRHVT